MIIDLRSDTVTRPTEAMYEAMRAAPLGDDVFRDDPTVIELEEESARQMGMEAALFVPSGTMGNQIAMATHCRPGDAAIFDEEAHILYYEAGGTGVLSGIVSWTLPSVRGIIDPNIIEARILKRSLHNPGTTLLCLENTHNRAGGAVVPPTKMVEYRSIADRHGLAIHLDGARVFNAAVALGIPVSEVVKGADTVNFCLSKGLGAPIGSVLCGTREFIERARRVRKMVGGGLRQVGVLAACGLVAFRDILPILGEDHRRARELGALLQGVPGMAVDQSLIQTSFVMVDTERPADEWLGALRELGVSALASSPNRIRLVFHHQISDDHVSTVATAFCMVSAGLTA